MSRFLDRIRELVRAGEVRISEHGEDELADDRLSARGLLAGVTDAVIVEEYIQTTRKDLVPYYDRETVRASQFTRFGVYRGGMIHQRCWLWRIGPIRREGKMTTQPGGEYMNRRKKTKYVHEGQYVAEVDVEWIEDETDWSPYHQY